MVLSQRTLNMLQIFPQTYNIHDHNVCWISAKYALSVNPAFFRVVRWPDIDCRALYHCVGWLMSKVMSLTSVGSDNDLIVHAITGLKKKKCSIHCICSCPWMPTFPEIWTFDEVADWNCVWVVYASYLNICKWTTLQQQQQITTIPNHPLHIILDHVLAQYVIYFFLFFFISITSITSNT